MTNASIDPPHLEPVHSRRGKDARVLPLWIAAVSLAVIAAVMIIASIQLVHAVQTTQASVVQLQQQIQQLRSGIGGLLGG